MPVGNENKPQESKIAGPKEWIFWFAVLGLTGAIGFAGGCRCGQYRGYDQAVDDLLGKTNQVTISLPLDKQPFKQ